VSIVVVAAVIAACTCLHRASIDLESVELLGSLRSTICPREDDRSNAAGLAIWSVRQKDLLDSSYGGCEVLLLEKTRVSLRRR
jgi:hypothetical protein